MPRGAMISAGCSGWRHIDEAPRDRAIEVLVPSKNGLPGFVAECMWHPDAGFCVDELREPVAWRETTKMSEGYQPRSNRPPGDPPNGGSSAARTKMSPCDEDLRMFIIGSIGPFAFLDEAMQHPEEMERALGQLVQIIRTGKVCLGSA